MEDWLIGFDGNRDWALLESSLELIGGVLWDISVSSDLNFSLGFIVFACEDSSVWVVWVVSLGFKSVAFSILESEVHHTSVTSVVQP